MATVAMASMMPGAGTVAGAHGHQLGMAEGNKTATIYGLIREGKVSRAAPCECAVGRSQRLLCQYADVVRLLNLELQSYPTSRAALSLLGYCHYYLQDFAAAATA